MATLAADSPRSYELGDRAEYAVIASDIIYEGAAVGMVTATGHARPLATLDEFVGFAEQKADNASGAAADINVRVRRKGMIELSVTSSVITDVGQPVYASDDDTFTFVAVDNVYVGRYHRHVSAGKGVVAFDTKDKDPYLEYGSKLHYETKAANYTLDIQDNGKVIFVDTDAVVITLPAVATPVDCTIVSMGGYGTLKVSISPNASDSIHAPDIAGTDDKDHINTKATQQRGDLVRISSGAGNAAGWVVVNQVGTWAQEA
jgi:hypothetical protein